MGSVVSVVRDATLPPDGQLKESSPVEKTGGGIQASWEVETTVDWPEYKKFLLGRLRPQYSLASESDTEMFLNRYLGGDAYGLRIVLITGGPPRRIRVAFHACPS